MLHGVNFDNEQERINVYSDNYSQTTFTYVWLRDHCSCQECQHPDTKQRVLDTFDLPEQLAILQATISPDGKELRVLWSIDSHYSIYPYSLFEGLRSDPENLDIERTLWTAYTFPSLSHVPQLHYEDFMKSDDTLLRMIEMTEEFGFCFVENVPSTPGATKEVCERVTYIRQTIFGGYYEMTANLEHKDTAYTPEAIGPHTDGTYSNDAPSYQVLHCIEANCVGGENILIDGFKIAEIMKDKYEDDFLTLTQIKVPGQYIDTVKGTHLIARRPIFRLSDDKKQVVQVSYNNHDRAPFYLSAEDSVDFYKALNTFSRLYSKPEFQFRRTLRPGSVLFFDNWRLLHAREAYSGFRRLAGAYFNKEDVESRLRVLRSKRNVVDVPY